jgi:S-DNA-T family DNA segregation ATPase FtsK/SpoIIIE
MVYRVGLHSSTKLSKVLGLGDSLALNMAAEAVRVGRNLGNIDVEVALPKDLRKSLSPRMLPRKPGTWVTIGQTAVGAPVMVNLASPAACHTLVAGTTGSGKTTAQMLVAWMLARNTDPNGAQMLVIDPAKEGIRWHGFDNEPHLAHPVITDGHQSMRALTWVLAELARRKSQGRSAPALFVIIDELKALLDISADAAALATQHISAIGREFGVHLVAATQYPNVQSVGGSITKSNLPLRLTGQVLSSQDAYICTGQQQSGAEKLNGKGDFLITVAGSTHRVQVANIGNREIGRLQRTLEPRTIDFGDYDPERIAHLLDLPPDPKQAAMLDPQHVAVALVHGRGVGWLKKTLHVGQKKAQDIRDFAADLRQHIEALGHTLYPIPQQ